MAKTGKFFSRGSKGIVSLLKKINWTYAMGEILLLFIGISLAIGFNNWNENRLQKKVELQTLKELKVAIERDKSDIIINIEGHENRQKAYKILIDYLEHKKPVTDTLTNMLPFIYGTTSFIANTAPYEMLKSRGLEIISIDSLRLKLLTYYDITQDWIMQNEKQHIDHHTTYTKPFVLQHLLLKDRKYAFIDYEKTLADQTIPSIFYWALREDGYILDLYRKALTETEDLAKLLKIEIERLE